MENSLRYLNTWENMLNSGTIKKEQFLTSNTAEGLRVTLQSMMDLIVYMNSKFNFDYILTGRVNQDSLEVSYFKSVLFLISIN